MAHFAEIGEDNLVLRVVVIRNEDILDESGNESEVEGIAFCRKTFGFENRWIQTSFNSSFRKNYAGIGYCYDSSLDAFLPPQPYASWVLNEDSCKWESPVPYPEDGNHYCWDEETKSWCLTEVNE